MKRDCLTYIVPDRYVLDKDRIYSVANSGQRVVILNRTIRIKEYIKFKKKSPSVTISKWERP